MLIFIYSRGKLYCNLKLTRRRYILAKAGMRRPDPEEPHGTESNRKHKSPKNDAPPAPEIQGKAKSGKKPAKD